MISAYKLGFTTVIIYILDWTQTQIPHYSSCKCQELSWHIRERQHTGCCCLIFFRTKLTFSLSSNIACRKILAVSGFYIVCRMSLLFHLKLYMAGCDCQTLLSLLRAHSLTVLTCLLWLISIIIHSTVAARESNDTLGPCYHRSSRNS